MEEILHDSNFLNGEWKPEDVSHWRGWLKHIPCCFFTLPSRNSLEVSDGKLTHRAGTLTTHFKPETILLRGHFLGTWKEEGCIICLPTPICCPACRRGEMSGTLWNDGTLELNWWDGLCKRERAVWSRKGVAGLHEQVHVAPIQQAMTISAAQVVGVPAWQSAGSSLAEPVNVAPVQQSMTMPSAQEAGVLTQQLIGTPSTSVLSDRYWKATTSEVGFLEHMILKQQCIQSKGMHMRTVPPVQTYAFIQNLGTVPDSDLMDHWSGKHKVLPEYLHASEMICLDQEWMSNTKALTHIQQISRSCSAELQRIKGDVNAFSNVMVRVIQRAYGLTDSDSQAARVQKDVLSQQPVFDKVKQCYDALEEWKKHLFIHAWQIILDHEKDTAAIVTKLSEVVDRALHCRQVQVQSFQLVLSHSANLLAGSKDHVEDIDAPVTAGKDACFTTALRRFYECFEDFLDDYKERAFSAAFMEPNRFYLTYSDVGPGFLKDNVDTHANNWYIALLNAALGVHVPLMATYWDDFPPPVCDFWAGLHDKAWQHYFSQLEHFGSSWQGIRGLQREGKELIRKKVKSGHLPDTMAGQSATVIGATYNVEMKPAKQFANNAVNPGGCAAHRRSLALYLERFAFFFERDRFIRKMFETLNSECKPEHHGFRAALKVLFEAYRTAQGGISEDTYVEHCYRDDLFTDLDIEHTSSLFAWLGILKARGQMSVEMEECPICLEITADVQPLLHTSNSRGEVSKHRACASCCKQMIEKNQSCPWCRDNMVWQKIFAFLDALKSDISVANQPDDLADLMGKWQEYEMTRSLHDVRKFAIDMVQDVAICTHLDRVLVNGNKAFMRDSAGLWIRFHAMVVDQEISVPPAEARRLQLIVEGALDTFEADGGGAPQHIGAMYTQLASALLCAIRSGSSISTLVQLLQRVGKASVNLHLKRYKNAAGVRERLPKEYVESVSTIVWGDAQDDIVLQTFFS